MTNDERLENLPNVIRATDAKIEAVGVSTIVLDGIKNTTTLVPKTEDTVAGVLNLGDTKEVVTDSPECSLEDKAFRIDSMGWKEIVLEDSTGNLINAKVNTEGDVWELNDGVQLFTPAAMFREIGKAGRAEDIITKEQAQWLMSNPDAIPEDIKYVGYLDSKDGKIHCKKETPGLLMNGDDSVSFQPKTAHFWIRSTFWSMQWAIQIDDVSSLEKESQSYFMAQAHKVSSSVHDMTSASQVLLLKKKTDK